MNKIIDEYNKNIRIPDIEYEIRRIRKSIKSNDKNLSEDELDKERFDLSNLIKLYRAMGGQYDN